MCAKTPYFQYRLKVENFHQCRSINRRVGRSGAKAQPKPTKLPALNFSKRFTFEIDSVCVSNKLVY